ncbi:MAG: hypothetical protein AAGC46_16185 [Solirubrobacteraceae bacterium]|nr:hypothetical protein [Patulibacter sp.]
MTKTKALTLAAVGALALSPAASAAPSVAGARAATEKKVRQTYRDDIKEYKADVQVTCHKPKKVSKKEWRFACDWMVDVGFSGGFDGVDTPMGTSKTFYDTGEGWTVFL